MLSTGLSFPYLHTHITQVRAIVNVDGSGDLPVIVGSGATLNTQANGNVIHIGHML